MVKRVNLLVLQMNGTVMSLHKAEDHLHQVQFGVVRGTSDAQHALALKHFLNLLADVRFHIIHDNDGILSSYLQFIFHGTSNHLQELRHNVVVDSTGEHFNGKDAFLRRGNDQRDGIHFGKRSHPDCFAGVRPNLSLEGGGVDVALINEDESLSHLSKRVQHLHKRVNLIRHEMRVVQRETNGWSFPAHAHVVADDVLESMVLHQRWINACFA